MTIDFTCGKCEGSFEIDSVDLIDGTEKLVCPHCDVKAPANLVDDFTSALTEMLATTAALSKKFTLSLAIESEEVVEEVVADDDDVDEDEDEESDDDELDFDDDDEDADDDLADDEDIER